MIFWKTAWSLMGSLILAGYFIAAGDWVWTFKFVAVLLIPGYFLTQLLLIPFTAPRAKRKYCTLSNYLSQFSTLWCFVMLFLLLAWLVSK